MMVFSWQIPGEIKFPSRSISEGQHPKCIPLLPTDHERAAMVISFRPRKDCFGWFEEVESQ